MRKLLIAFACLLTMTGFTVASEVTLIKYDKTTKEIMVQEVDVASTYKITDTTKFIAVDKKTGEIKDLPYEKVVEGLTNPKAEGVLKLDITVKDGEVIEAKLPGRKKK